MMVFGGCGVESSSSFYEMRTKRGRTENKRRQAKFEADINFFHNFKHRNRKSGGLD